MEKWAKTLNQKKAAAAANLSQTSASSNNPVHTVNIGKSIEDVGFSVLSQKSKPEAEAASAGSAGGLAKLAGYNSEEDEDGNNASSASEVVFDETQFSDWSQLACLLCKRKFPSREKLTK